MIVFKCSKCGKDLQVDDNFAGKQAQCPFCKEMVQIPAAAAPARVSPFPQAPQGQGQTPPQPPAPGYRPPAPGYAPYAPTPPKPKYPGKGRIITTCILLLLTVGIPWGIAGSNITWSWDVLDLASDEFMAYVIAAWSIGLVMLILAFILRGLAFSVPLLLLGATGFVLLLVFWDDLAMITSVLRAFSTGKQALMIATLATLIGLLLLVSIRIRIGSNIPIGILEALAAAGLGVLWGIANYDAVRAVVKDLDKLGDAEWYGIVAVCTMLAINFFILLGCLMAFIHGLVVNAKSQAVSRVALAFLSLAVSLYVALVIAMPVLQRKPSPEGSLSMFVVMTLGVSMPLLMGCGVSYVISDVVNLFKKPAPAQS